MFRFVILTALFVAGNCQVFGGPDHIGYNQQLYKDDRNTVNGYGKIYPNSPISLGAGANWKNTGGHGAALDVLNTPHTGITGARVSGQVGLAGNDRNNLYAYGSHARTFNSRFDTLGRQNQAGLGFSHTSRDGRTNVGLQGGATFNPGMKPVPGIQFGLSHSFGRR